MGLNLNTAFQAARLRVSMENIWRGNIGSALSWYPEDFDAVAEAEALARRLEDARVAALTDPGMDTQRDGHMRTTSVSRLIIPDVKSGYPPVRVQALAHYSGRMAGFQTIQYPQHLSTLEAHFTTEDGLDIGIPSPLINVASELHQPSHAALRKLLVVGLAVETLELPLTTPVTAGQ